ncbi:hypothetical protein PINS_up020736 [Pythium insidiosum]|nr:hypothetical protein PINS_up020736 [Pythium insidiosum]
MRRTDKHAGLPVFEDSVLTQLIQDCFGGNTLALSLSFFSERDFQGSKASCKLSEKVRSIDNFPIVNNETVRGLLQRRQKVQPDISSTPSQLAGSTETDVYVSKIHDLERQLAQEVVTKKLLREDKDQVVAVMNELKIKYQQLFDNEIEIRKELLQCEQEKLTLSKAFVEFQIEKNTQLQDIDAARFELENKLVQTEEMLLQIQEDDRKKTSQIQDLCQKINEVIQDKQELARNLELLQTRCGELDSVVAQERKKNQQLSLELIVLVNQKKKYMSDIEAMEMQGRLAKESMDTVIKQQQDLRESNEALQSKTIQLATQLDQLRSELARKTVRVGLLSTCNLKKQKTSTTSKLWLRAVNKIWLGSAFE